MLVFFVLFWQRRARWGQTELIWTVHGFVHLQNVFLSLVQVDPAMGMKLLPEHRFSGLLSRKAAAEPFQEAVPVFPTAITHILPQPRSPGNEVSHLVSVHGLCSDDVCTLRKLEMNSQAGLDSFWLLFVSNLLLLLRLFFPTMSLSRESSVFTSQSLFKSWRCSPGVWRAMRMFLVGKAIQRKIKKSPASHETRLLGVSYPGCKRRSRRVQQGSQERQNCWSSWQLPMVT